MARRSQDEDAVQQKFTNEDGETWDAAASDLPKAVAEAVGAYEKARRACGRATDKKHSTHEAALEAMKKAGVEQAPYTDENGNRGWLYVAQIEKLKTRQLKKPKTAGDNDEV